MASCQKSHGSIILSRSRKKECLENSNNDYTWVSDFVLKILFVNPFKTFYFLIILRIKRLCFLLQRGNTSWSEPRREGTSGFLESFCDYFLDLIIS